MTSRRWQRTALAALIAATALIYGANRWLGVPSGLRATYFSGTSWQDERTAVTTIDSPPSTANLKARRPDFARRPFSVEWSGFIIVPVGGTYTFRTISDDGSWLYVHGREVVTNAGRHAAMASRGSIALDAGVHPIFIRYFQDTLDCAFELSWSRDGREFRDVPAWALLPEPASFARTVAARLTWFALVPLAMFWYLGAVAVGGQWLLRAADSVFAIRRDGVGPALGSVLLLSAILGVWGIWWAIPNPRGWAPDELVPVDVLAALQSMFSHGWYEKYPPFHYMVLTIADSPVLLLSQLGLVGLYGTPARVALTLLGRLVSLAFGVGTVLVVHRCGLQLYGRRGAVFAALTMALTVPFAYYAKLANLDAPYLFWFAVSLLAYIRLLQRHDARDYLLFAFSAALAGCTKDQAWGLYFLTPFAIVAARWRAGRPLVDATVLAAVGVGLATLLVADNVLFNFGGFVAHVKLVLGTPAAFHEFPATWRGESQMAWQAIREMRYMLGWPLAIIAAMALLQGVAGRSGAPLLRWLLVPALSYYIAFIGAILFFFDRYLLPVTLVLSLYVGCWLERFTAPGVRARSVRLAAAYAAFAYSVVYVVCIDYAMSVDSRYTVTRWLQAHAHADDVIGSIGPLEFAALADDFRWQTVESIEDVANLQPAFVVLNPDLMPDVPSWTQAMHRSLLNGFPGYRLALRARSPSLPLPGAHPDLGAAPRHGPEFSDLSMINPTIEIFERMPPESTRAADGYGMARSRLMSQPRGSRSLRGGTFPR